jgi:putative sterol carrier protein
MPTTVLAPYLYPVRDHRTSTTPADNSFSDDFPSSAAFDAIAQSLSTSDADRKDAIKKGNGIFAFELKNTAGAKETWHIDLKHSGAVGKGPAPEGKKPSVTLVLSDADFHKLVEGKANAQKLFMSGKLKVKGDVMKATKLEPVFKRVQSKAKL